MSNILAQCRPPCKKHSSSGAFIPAHHHLVLLPGVAKAGCCAPLPMAASDSSDERSRPFFPISGLQTLSFINVITVRQGKSCTLSKKSLFGMARSLEFVRYEKGNFGFLIYPSYLFWRACVHCSFWGRKPAGFETVGPIS